MPGSRGRDFRGGDLAEGLGLEMLRPFAFIAPVPRPEDVGLDAVATLFRRETHRLIAEDSFLVQAKAASVRKIEYRDGELDWLRCLTLPCYWLSVDLKTTTFELWSMIRASGHPNFRDRKAITVYLDERPFELSDDEMHVWLQKPILRWTPIDAVGPAFQETFYNVMKAWIAFEMRCLAVRPLGMTLPVTWETGSPPQSTGTYTIMHHRDQTHSVLEQLRPHIQTLSSLAFSSAMPSSDGSGDGLLIGLILVSEYMRQQGVDPDPNHILPTLARFRQQQVELASADPAPAVESSG